jgi:hypothetical protein
MFRSTPRLHSPGYLPRPARASQLHFRRLRARLPTWNRVHHQALGCSLLKLPCRTILHLIPAPPRCRSCFVALSCVFSPNFL